MRKLTACLLGCILLFALASCALALENADMEIAALFPDRKVIFTYAWEGEALALTAKQDKIILTRLEKKNSEWEIAQENDSFFLPGADPATAYMSVLSEEKRAYIGADCASCALNCTLVSDGESWSVEGVSAADPYMNAAFEDGLATVHSDILYDAIFPAELDLSFTGFSAEEALNFIKACEKSRDDAPLIPNSGETDALPQGRVIQFTKGKRYPVYSGPGEDYLRAANGKAAVSTDGWIQVLGREGDWLLIQYNIVSGQNRFGYITAKALPKGETVPELAFTREKAVAGFGWWTDDPLGTSAETLIEDGTEIVILGSMGSEWSYFEIVDERYQKARGFTPVGAYSLRSKFAGTATVNVEKATLYTAPDGGECGYLLGSAQARVLNTNEKWTKLRLSGEVERYIHTADLLFDAAPTDTPFSLSAVTLWGEPMGEKTPYRAGLSQDSEIIYEDARSWYRESTLLGETDGYALLRSQYDSFLPDGFYPMKWVLRLPKSGTLSQQKIRYTARETELYLSPDDAYPAGLTLFAGVQVYASEGENGYSYVTNGYQMMSGYVHSGALTDAPSPLKIARLTPQGGADTLMAKGYFGSDQTLLGYGCRVMLAGRAGEYTLARLYGSDMLTGFIRSDTLTETNDTCLYDELNALTIGQTTIRKNEAACLHQFPFVSSWQSFDCEPGESAALLADLGAWKQIACKRQDTIFTGFLPASSLSSYPVTEGAFEGVQNILRDEPVVIAWYGPMLAQQGDIAFAVLRNDENALVLNRYALENDTWTLAESYPSALPISAYGGSDGITLDESALRVSVGGDLGEEKWYTGDLSFEFKEEQWRYVSLELTVNNQTKAFTEGAGTALTDFNGTKAVESAGAEFF